MNSRHVDADHAPPRCRTGTRRAPCTARSCRRRWARGTGTSRSGGADRRVPRASGGWHSRRCAPPRPGRRRACASASSMRSSFSFSPSSILRDRDAGPLGDDFGDLLLGDLVAHQRAAFLVLGRHGAAASASPARECGRTAAPPCGPGCRRGARCRARGARARAPRGSCAAPCRDAFSDFHTSSRSAYSRSSSCERLLESRRRLREASSFSFFSASLLDLQLNDASLEPIERLGLGVDLHADARGGLVDEVDGLVGQLAVGDVAMRQRRRGDDAPDR